MQDKEWSNEDINPHQMEHSEVLFADPVNQLYPIDTRQHVLDAWNWINQKESATQYSKSELRLVKDRIKQAARKIGFEINEG